MPLIHRGVVTTLGKMDKTVTVTVPYRKLVKKLKYDVTQHRKYLVHDEKQLTHLNDMVTIIHTTPKYSSRKAFRIYEIHRQGKSPDDYAQPDPAWKKLMEKRTVEAERIRQREVTEQRAERRARKLSGTDQNFLGDLVDVGRPPRRIVGDVGQASGSGPPLGTEVEANIEESDEAYDHEVEGHEDEEVVQEEELDREIEEYERSQDGRLDQSDRDADSVTAGTSRRRDGGSGRNQGGDGGERR